MVKTPLRILHVTPAYYPAQRYGGPIQSVHGLALHLAQQVDMEVTVFTTNMDGRDVLDVPTAQPVLLDGVLVYYFPVVRPRSYAHSPAMARAFAQTLRDYDLVHIHGLYLHPTFAAARSCQRQGVPYLVAPRGMLDPHAFALRSVWKKRLYWLLAERHNLAKAAALHFTSAEEEQLAAVWRISTQGVVVPNGLDLARFPDEAALALQKQQRPAEQETVLFLSRITPKKGLDLLIPAFAIVAKQRPTARLIIAGPDDEGYMAAVMGWVNGHGLQERVTYVGMLTGQNKLDTYAHADLFVLPSYSENFGMVVIEALACQTPVVVTDRVNIHPEVKAAKAGCVSSCAPEPLAEAMLYLLADKEENRQMGINGRRLVAEKFAWSSVATQMRQVYHSILSPH